MIIEDEAMLDTFREKRCCEFCKLYQILDPHHIWQKGLGGGSRLDIAINLISLCRTCHNKAHAKTIKKCELLAIVAKREKTSAKYIEEKIHLLLRSPKAEYKPRRKGQRV